jgi:uncharacterized protein (TIGR03083 family)
MGHPVVMAEDLPSMDVEAVRTAVAQAAANMAAVVEQIDDPSVQPDGSEWTVADIAAHVTAGAELYIGYLRGDTPPALDVSDIADGSLARTTAAFLAAYPERDPHVLAGRLQDAIAELLRATEGLEIDALLQWHGEQITIGALLGLTLGELLLHGADIASALGRPWEITDDAARITMTQAFSTIGLLVNPATAAGVHRTFEVRLRGGARFILCVDDGTILVRPASGREQVDCRVSADPLALLLIAYGRTSQWRPIMRGKLLAWGRRPWLGLRLAGYLVAP